MLRLCSLLVLLALMPSAGAAAALEGPARVIDGDTLEIEGVRVRLFGIDAPERNQTCGERDLLWSCGEWATERLELLLGGGQVRCTGAERDRYGRLLATCEVDGQDVGARMVRSGAALAYRRYSMRYVGEEGRAQAEGTGVWSGPMQRPEDYRHSPPAPPPPGECAIKGNVSKNGRIYHLPGQADYDRTVISGPEERWFCNAREAESAGFRPARR
ncbi:thermonuclease family protein [Cereibacter azotoformans]|uniref:thermonuclease family protein n=1 Tax=Cereibacter azotoformans TaxID=43057 RepID=UPI000C6D6D41|nr:thermonuclease family protein [Cereibacter azotoformans]